MRNIHKPEFAARIKQAREARRESQQSVATFVGVSKQSVSDWENVDKPSMPKGDRLDKLLSVLNITFDSNAIKANAHKDHADPMLAIIGRLIDVLENNAKEHKLELAKLERDKERLYASNVELNARITMLQHLLDHPEHTMLKNS